MNRAATALIAAIAGAGVALAFERLWFATELPAQVPQEPVPADGPSWTQPRGSADSDSTAWLRIDEQLRALGGRLAALDAKLTAFAAREPVRAAHAPGGEVPAALAPTDVDTIVRALEQVEAKKLDALSLGELLARANMHLKTGEVAEARRVVEAALTRPLEPDDRARALTQLGMIHRSSGDFAASATALEQVVAEFGMESPRGSEAAYQLIWTRSKSGDQTAATQLAYRLAQATNLPEATRIQARWAAAITLSAGGDPARGRAEFAAILRELDGREEHHKLLEDIRRRLDAGK